VSDPARRVRFRLGNRRAVVDRSKPFRKLLRPRRLDRRPHTVRALVIRSSGSALRLRQRAKPCT